MAERYLRDDEELTDGLAILSRRRVVDSQVLTLTKAPTDERGRPDFHRRIAQVVELEDGIKIINTHLASNNNAHLQLRELLGLAPANCIVLGDFNIPKPTSFAEVKITSGLSDHSAIVGVVDTI